MSDRRYITPVGDEGIYVLDTASWRTHRPVMDKSLCVNCGLCARICPTGAISPGDGLHTDAGKCIRCAACVKDCPHGARTYATPFAAVLSRNFSRPKRNVWMV